MRGWGDSWCGMRGQLVATETISSLERCKHAKVWKIHDTVPHHSLHRILIRMPSFTTKLFQTYFFNPFCLKSYKLKTLLFSLKFCIDIHQYGDGRHGDYSCGNECNSKCLLIEGTNSEGITVRKQWSINLINGLHGMTELFLDFRGKNPSPTHARVSHEATEK